jgi:hypothetical protein
LWMRFTIQSLPFMLNSWTLGNQSLVNFYLDDKSMWDLWCWIELSLTKIVQFSITLCTRRSKHYETTSMHSTPLLRLPTHWGISNVTTC